MIMLFFSKKFWLVVFALVVLNYGCNHLERRGSQVAQTKRLSQRLVQHDVNLKVMTLNTILEDVRKKSTFDASILAESTQLRDELFKVKLGTMNKPTTEVKPLLLKLDSLEKRILEIAKNLNSKTLAQEADQLRGVNAKLPDSMKKFEDAEQTLQKYESNVFLRRFIKTN